MMWFFFAEKEFEPEFGLQYSHRGHEAWEKLAVEFGRALLRLEAFHRFIDPIRGSRLIGCQSGCSSVPNHASKCDFPRGRSGIASANAPPMQARKPWRWTQRPISV